MSSLNEPINSPDFTTFLGATYAGLFPTHVGRMVLDGAIDPSLSTVQMSLVQAHGFEVALRAYVGHCTSQPNCFLGSTVDQGPAFESSNSRGRFVR